MRYPPRRPRTSHYKEKTMGRPINKSKIGFGAGRIRITRHFFTGGSEATTAAHIIRQTGAATFVCRLDSNNDGNGAFSPATHANDEELTLVNKANGALVAGEFKIDATLDDSSTVQVTKLYNRTIQTEDNNRMVYGVGTFADPGKGTENAAEQAMIESQ